MFFLLLFSSTHFEWNSLISFRSSKIFWMSHLNLTFIKIPEKCITEASITFRYGCRDSTNIYIYIKKLFPPMLSVQRVRCEWRRGPIPLIVWNGFYHSQIWICRHSSFLLWNLFCARCKHMFWRGKEREGEFYRRHGEWRLIKKKVNEIKWKIPCEKLLLKKKSL